MSSEKSRPESTKYRMSSEKSKPDSTKYRMSSEKSRPKVLSTEKTMLNKQQSILNT